jgi:N-methylhydantoinase A/oxoprolinase/acetone carboxylase beta subunit
MRIGIDTGGTFTDFVLWDGNRLQTRKIRSTPDDPARAILEGLAGLAPVEVVHGSTVATNALLERKGARTAFITTAGFEDLLAIQRQNRQELYNLFGRRSPALVDADCIIGVAERTLYDGSIEQSLAEGTPQELARTLRDLGVESVAVCLLHSYANSEHERQIGAALRELEMPGEFGTPGKFFVSLSHEVLPEYREFERASTTVVNAYVSPKMGRYLHRLDETLGAARLRVFQSNAGSVPAKVAAQNAVHTVLSGPAGGVLGATAVAREAGFERVISFDMGGTSTDVSLYDRELSYTTESSLADLPIRVPMLDIHSVGAGGGSVAYLDQAGALKVGPRSAGAEPGPVCYGTGEEITVTDANLALGRINPEEFLSGRMALDVERMRHYLRRFAESAGVSPQALAEAVVDVANSNMERAIRAISVERGHGPRDFALLSFGGAGAQHACELAQRLEIKTVIVPRHAGVLSAVGMLCADCVRHYSHSVLHADADETLRVLESQAARDFADQGFEQVLFERYLDLRYQGQSFELTLPAGERAQFHAAHRKRYGYDHAGRDVEAVTARLKAIGLLPKLDLAAPSERETFSSLYIPPGWRPREDAMGNCILTRS